MVRYLVNQLQVFSFVGVKHGFADGGSNFLFVEADDAAVSFDNSLYHNYGDVWGDEIFFLDDAKLSNLSESLLFWKTFIPVKIVKSFIISMCVVYFGKLRLCICFLIW